MVVAYDHQIFSLQSYGGVSRYFIELAAAIAADPDFDARIIAPVHLNRLLRADDRLNSYGVYVPHLRGTGALRFRFNTLASRLLIRSVPDVVHETYFSSEGSGQRRVNTVVTVFDMIHELFPQSFPADDPTGARKRAAVLRASRVICISESTRRDLLQVVPVEPDRVSVVPLAASSGLAKLASSTRPVAREYVLYVGQREGYKNFAACAMGFARSGLLASGFVLVCFGGGGWSAADSQAASAAGVPASAILHVAGDDDVLATLYTHARLFVYPSLYEGFGIPPLEAMSCGCPVACSNTSSLPEVVGDAAETFDPNDVGDIARALLRITDEPGRADELRSRGARRVAEFSWARCAEQTKAVYKSLA